MTVVPMVVGSALCMIIGSLVTSPPRRATIEKYFGTQSGREPKEESLRPAAGEVRVT